MAITIQNRTEKIKTILDVVKEYKGECKMITADHVAPYTDYLKTVFMSVSSSANEVLMSTLGYAIYLDGKVQNTANLDLLFVRQRKPVAVFGLMGNDYYLYADAHSIRVEDTSEVNVTGQWLLLMGLLNQALNVLKMRAAHEELEDEAMFKVFDKTFYREADGEWFQADTLEWLSKADKAELISALPSSRGECEAAIRARIADLNKLIETYAAYQGVSPRPVMFRQVRTTDHPFPFE